MNVVLLSADLLAQSQVSGAGDLNLRAVTNAEQAVEACQERRVALVLVDLSTAGLHIDSLVSDLAGLENAPDKIIAFGPHVHTARLAAARDAGCNEVIHRGVLQDRVRALAKC